MEAIAAVDALKLSVPLQARVGIATGLVVVGDLIGSGEAHRSLGIVLMGLRITEINEHAVFATNPSKRRTAAAMHV